MSKTRVLFLLWLSQISPPFFEELVQLGSKHFFYNGLICLSSIIEQGAKDYFSLEKALLSYEKVYSEITK